MSGHIIRYRVIFRILAFKLPFKSVLSSLDMNSTRLNSSKTRSGEGTDLLEFIDEVRGIELNLIV